VLALFVLGGSDARAAEIHWSIEGRVAYVSGDAAAAGIPVQVGDLGHALLGFTEFPVVYGVYGPAHDGDAEFQIQIGAFEASIAPGQSQNWGIATDPSNSFRSFATGPLLDTFHIADLELGWQQLPSELFDPLYPLNPIFPSDPPPLSALLPFSTSGTGPTTGLFIMYDSATVALEITSMERLPEPSISALAALGLGWLALSRRLRTG
jgi:hypothetical protein